MDFTLPLTPQYTQTGGTTKAAATSSLFGDYAIAATILFTLVVFLFEAYLNFRQRKSYHKTDFPRELETTVGNIDRETKSSAADKKVESSSKSSSDDDKKDKVDRDAPILPQLKSKFSHAQSYGLDKINFSIFSSTYAVTEEVVFLLYGFLPYVWDKACAVGAKYGWTETEHEIKITLLFLGIVTIVGTITSLPFELYSTFEIEKKHGFNKQTLGLFFTDKLKGLVLSAVFGGPFVALLLKIIFMGGDKFYLYVWAFTFVFSVIMMTLVPVVIMPLFNKYEKLPDGPLKDSIYELAGKLSFPLTKLFVMDGSKRSSHSNAFMFGFMKNKRIVLFDTLMTQVSNDEILAILGHELGHWKMGHTVTNFVVTQVYTGFMFYFFSLCYNSHELYRAFGFDDQSRPIPTIIALVLFTSTIWAPVDKALSFIMTVHSRKCEFQADEFSVDLGMSSKLQSGLCKIHLENLGAMSPDSWYSTYHYSHPPLVERLSAMMKLDTAKKLS
mmetsp:Transcript_9551/g.14328  ORF Transcript_9551/g.14328 Transcript_9551/m.14328 type:complete len:499 (-) Transcript_9551:2169-3665(-)